MSFHSGLANWQLEVINRYVLTISTYCKSKSCGNPRAWWHMWHDRNSSGLEKTQLKRFKLGRPMRSQHPFVPSSSQLEIVIRIIDYYPTIIPFLHPLNLKIQYRTPKMVIGKLFFMVIHHGHFGVPPEFTGWMKNDLKSHLGRLHRLAV